MFHLPDQAGLAREFSRRWESVKSMRAEARVTATGGEGAYPGRMILVMKKPGRLRADFFDPFGRPAGLVIINGNEVVEYLPEAGGGSTRPTIISLLARLAAVRRIMPADALAALAVGMPGEKADNVRFAWKDEDAAKKDGPGTLVLLEEFDGDLVAGEIIGRGETAGTVRAAYGRWFHQGELVLPRRVTFGLPEEGGWSLRIDYGEVETNVELDEGLFSTRINGS